MGCCSRICQSNIILFTKEKTESINPFIQKISDLTVTVFDLLEQAGKVFGQFLLKTLHICKLTNGVASIISLGFTVAEIVRRDFWQSSWLAITSTLTLIVQKITSIMAFMHYTKLVALTKILVPLNLINNISGIISCVCDTALQIITITSSNKKTSKIKDYLRSWKQIRSDWNTTDKWETIRKNVQTKLALIKETVANNPKEEDTLKRKQEQYEHFLVSKATAKEIYDYKITRLEIKQKNESMVRTKQWIGMAYNVAFIAFAVFSLAIPIPGLLLALAIGGISVLASALDLTSEIGKLFKEKDLPRFNALPTQATSTGSKSASFEIELTPAPE